MEFLVYILYTVYVNFIHKNGLIKDLINAIFILYLGYN